MSRRSWVMLAVEMGLLIGGAVPSTARADSEPDVEKHKLDYGFMVTSYYMFNAHRVSGPYNDFQYPYADSQGFGLVFAGGGVRYEAEKWGVLLELRWGQNVDQLTEIAPISRAFVRWIPVERERLRLIRGNGDMPTLAPDEGDAPTAIPVEKDRVKLDLGYFGAFIGIESADEWTNANFTRGIVYFKIQPFRHLGLRASATPHEKVDVTVIVARGSIFGTEYPSEVRRSVQAPALGAQIWYRPSDTTDLRLGAVTSPNGSNGNRDWQAILDFIAIWKPKALALYVDGDYQFSRRGPLTGLNASKQWGVSLGGRYDITDDWSVGFRGEYFGSDDSAGLEKVFTVTGTVRYSPVQYLILSLEPRAEFAGNDIFFSRPLVTDPATGSTVPTLNQDWFFGFWIGATARIGN